MSIRITPKAINEVKRIIAEQNLPPDQKVYLRLAIRGGGCSGFQPRLDLDQHYNEKNDELMEFDGLPVVVDRKSNLYLSEAVIDFHDELNRRGFSVDIPNAKSKCGCGSSFSM
ncbi:MAG: iron-sulfur cluster assembly accessory protein [Gemmatales bacterium]|nr:iron-sulfur cluster assembly accessory protein [Gemmatales bacterium]MDW8386946.1 iron-sulfur cluster assembly accessory protein [Gemmatales bacterium]